MNLLKMIRSFFTKRRMHPKRVMGRRDIVFKYLLDHKYLDCYTIAGRSNLSPMVVSKTLSTAVRDNEPIERIKKRVTINTCFGRNRKSQTVWCYRKKQAVVFDSTAANAATIAKVQTEIKNSLFPIN